MSQMKIKVVAVELGNGTTKNGKPYEFIEVTYKNLSFEGKTESKKIMPFGAKEVFNTLRNAESGTVYTLIREKDAGGYWQWIGIAEGDEPIDNGYTQKAAPNAAPTQGKVAPNVSPKSTYETPEERAKKQVYIVRQSSVANAIELLKTDKKVPAVDEVLATAKIFEDYVFGVNLDAEAVAVKTKLPELDDEDIPM